MTLDQIPSGASVFVDSNILVYHFQPHPTFGPMCHRLTERIENKTSKASPLPASSQNLPTA
jgi:predicted nucleic acid-binding protein